MLDMMLSTATPMNLLLIGFGVIWGMVFGIIPGLTATLAVVVLIPVTYGMSSVSGISMLIGIYIGAISGGLVSATLIGMPGTPSSITTTFDGFPLSKQGKAMKALGVGVTSNLIGCLLGWIFLVTMAPQIAKLALSFGPFEYVAIILFGLTAVVSLSGDSFIKGVVMAVFGLLVATIGMDPTFGMARNTFGLDMLRGGVSSIPAMIGLFVISQVFKESEVIATQFLIPKQEKTSVFMTKKEFVSSIPNFCRSGIIGVLIGILPGIGGALSNFVAYDQAKKASKVPEQFGKGSIEGIVASEVANNATIAGALIPMIALGIPGDAVTAALLGGLQLHGLQPGPLLIKENPQIVYGVFASFIFASVLMFVLMMFGIRIFPKILRIKKSHLLPVVLAAGLIGCYNLQYSINDVWIALIFGLIGYLLSKKDFPIAPIVISLVLGKSLETNINLALVTTGGNMLDILSRPIAMVFLFLAVISVLWTLIGVKKVKAFKK